MLSRLPRNRRRPSTADPYRTSAFEGDGTELCRGRQGEALRTSGVDRQEIASGDRAVEVADADPLQRFSVAALPEDGIDVVAPEQLALGEPLGVVVDVDDEPVGHGAADQDRAHEVVEQRAGLDVLDRGPGREAGGEGQDPAPTEAEEKIVAVGIVLRGQPDCGRGEQDEQEAEKNVPAPRRERRAP